MTFDEVSKHANRMCNIPDESGAVLCGDPDGSLEGYYIRLSFGTPSVAHTVVKGFCSNEPLSHLIERTGSDFKAFGYVDSDTQQIFYRMPQDYKAILQADGFCFDDQRKVVAAHYRAMITFLPLSANPKSGT